MPPTNAPDRASRVGLLGIAAVTLWRVALLPFDAADLFTDDAQYWLWGQDLAWGYYSKPPLIGWILRASTALGGDGMFWIRLPLPLIHGLTALAILLLGRALIGPRVGAIAGLAYVTAPAVAVGSLLVSTDTPMLLCFAIALLAHWHLTRARALGWALALGAAVGVGALAKYAMLYFVLCAILAALLLRPAQISWRDAGVAALVALAILAPNLWWNYANSFSTVVHIANDNASLDKAARFDAARLAEFLLGQFAISGPVIFGAYLVGLRAWRRDPRVAYLALFSLPILGVVTLVGLRGEVNANWAAAAHVAAFVLAAAVLRDRPRWLAAGLGVNLVVTLALPLAVIFTPSLRLGSGDLLLGRYTGRADLSRAAARVAADADLDTLVSGDRSTLADAFYTLRDSGLAIYAEPSPGFPPHHYAQKHPLPPGPGEVLYLTTHPEGPECRGAAAGVAPVATIPLHGFSTKTMHAFRVPRACFFAP